MSFIDKLQDAGTSLFDQSVVSLSRRIDNELNSDFMPSPAQATGESPVVKINDNNPNSIAKVAGTGNSFLAGVNKSTLAIGGGVVIAGVVAWLALR